MSISLFISIATLIFISVFSIMIKVELNKCDKKCIASQTKLTWMTIVSIASVVLILLFWILSFVESAGSGGGESGGGGINPLLFLL